MSFITLKNEFNEDILACRTCLATDRKLYSIYQDDIVLKAYKNLIGSEVYPYDTLPQYICNYCCMLLLKYSTFQYDCQRATRYLEDARINNAVITQEYLSNFKPQVQYRKTKTKHINYNNNNYIEKYTNFITDNTDDSYNNDYTSLDTENSQMDTQNIQIKEENNIATIDTEFQNKTIDDKKSSLETGNSQMDTQNIEIKKEINTPAIEDIEAQNKFEKNSEKVKKKGKYFETKDNMDDFEKSFNVEIVILSKEQQFKDVLERKNSSNYLQSPYKCENCYKGYMSEDILKKHIISQHDKSRGAIICEFCKFRYKDRRGLNHHLKTHRLKFICKQCAYVSRTTFNAKEHFKMHGGQVHQCSHCGKSHEKLSSHLSHIRLNHPSSLVWCQICAQACVGEFGLNAHMKKAHRDFHLPISCATCKTRFVSDAALTRHSSVSRCSEHSCVHCGDGYDDAVALREHLLVHQSERVFKCEKCDKTFKRENLYSAHYKRIHVDNQDKSMKKIEKPWICEVCGKTLPNKSLLLYHQRNHTGEKPYRCTQCTKSFTMRKLLQSHLRVHTNDRPYVCKLCPKTFKGLSALRGHEYIHTGQTKISSKNRVIK